MPGNYVIEVYAVAPRRKRDKKKEKEKKMRKKVKLVELIGQFLVCINGEESESPIFTKQHKSIGQLKLSRSETGEVVAVESE